MKIFSLAFIGILLCIQPLFAQNENVSLLVQSPDGKTVKLIWVLKNWSSEITGFDIKRKEGLEDLQFINGKQWSQADAQARAADLANHHNGFCIRVFLKHL